MSYYFPPWNNALEPNQGNVRQWLDNLYGKFQPIEQSRWNQSNIDTLFYAGSQTFINRYFNFTPGTSYQQFYFNLLQQPVNMVTGYQRQHRKNGVYIPSEGADPNTTDQYTRLITHAVNASSIQEDFSKACELAAITGMVLLQPYLDYQDDPAQGSLRLKVWEYNAFLVDPYFRFPDMSDAQFVWTQEYISKKEAEDRFPDKVDQIAPMSGTPQRYGSFYFLPENYNLARNDLMVLSYVWYKWKTKKKKLYSPSRHQFFDFGGGQEQLDQILYNIPDLQAVEVEVPTWKLAVVLNDILMYQGKNPLGFDSSCPFIPVFWNYEPHINYYDLRARGLVRTMRDTQFLLNRRIIINHDISESSINTGWMRKVGAVANEDNLKRAGQGYDVIVNDGFELTDVQKIIPNAVPPSDMELANQLADLIFSTSGVNIENWSAQEDKQASSLTVLLKQAANLMVLQKYFDQWDYSLKLLWERLLQIALNNWNASKVGLILGEEPSPHFYSRIFAKYQVIVEEGLNTATQKNMQAHQLLEINQMFGREVFPPSMIIKDMNLSGKAEAMEYLQQQEQQQQVMQQEAQNVAHVLEEAKLKELYSKAANNLASAKERYGRFESNVGLLEERMSELAKNHSLSTKAKMEALEKMMDVIAKYGEIETMLKMNNIDSFDYQNMMKEDNEKAKAHREAISNEFVSKMMAGIDGQQGQMRA